MSQPGAREYLDLARSHLERVQSAWDDPTDWTDLVTYGFYCLEAAVMAAATHLNWSVRRTHTGKAETAERLSREVGLPEIEGLLSDLNSARKWCEGFISAASNDSNIDAIVAVGSAIRNVSEIADIDLITIYSNTKPVLGSLPMDVDIRLYDRKEVENLVSRGHDLLGWAIKFGCVVFERNRYWTMLQSRWINRLPLPSVEEVMARAARTKKLYRELSAVGDEDAAAEQFVSMLTHLARARLIKAGVFPASRPELQEQLRGIGEKELAQKLTHALNRRWKHSGG